MRIPYYLALYQEVRPNSAKPSSAPLAAIVVAGLVLVYVGFLLLLLAGGWL